MTQSRSQLKQALEKEVFPQIKAPNVSQYILEYSQEVWPRNILTDGEKKLYARFFDTKSFIDNVILGSLEKVEGSNLPKEKEIIEKALYEIFRLETDPNQAFIIDITGFDGGLTDITFLPEELKGGQIIDLEEFRKHTYDLYKIFDEIKLEEKEKNNPPSDKEVKNAFKRFLNLTIAHEKEKEANYFLLHKLRSFAKRGWNPNNKYKFTHREPETLLSTIVLYRDPSLVKLLLDIGANPNLDSPLFESIIEEEPWDSRVEEMIETLLEYGWEPEIGAMFLKEGGREERIKRELPYVYDVIRTRTFIY